MTRVQNDLFETVETFVVIACVAIAFLMVLVV